MNDSPKTPNSISKSTPLNSGHFTPCRQMGLSRKRKSSTSIASPLHVTDKPNNETANETPKTRIKLSNCSIDNGTPKSMLSYPLNTKNLNVLLSKEEHTDEETIKLEIKSCKSRIEEKKQILNELQKSVTNSNDNNLKQLIIKWRLACQNALNMLLDKIKENTAIDMNKLLHDLNIPASLVQYDTENDLFL